MDVIERFSKTRAVKWVCSVIESPFFMLASGAAALLFYVLQMPMSILVLFAVFGIWHLFFGRDTRPLLPLLLFGTITFRHKYGHEPYLTPEALLCYKIFGTALALGVLYRLLFRRTHCEKTGFLGILLFCSALLVGGIGSDLYAEHLGSNLNNAVTLSLCLLLGYGFFALTMEKREGNLLYLARVCAVAVCMIALEVLDIYIQHYEWGTPLNGTWKGKILFGWTISNMGVEMLVFLLPAVFYLIYKERFGYFYYLVVAVGFVGMYFVFCRNALLWATLVLLVGFGYNLLWGRNKTINRFCTVGLAVAFFITLTVLHKLGHLEKITEFLRKKGWTDSGRFGVWKNFWHLFLQAPILGVGFDGYKYLVIPVNIAKAHSVILQMLASSGLVGLALYLGHRVQTVRSLLKNRTHDRLLMSTCVWTGVGLGMLSSIFFHSYFLIFYGVFLSVLDKE